MSIEKQNNKVQFLKERLLKKHKKITDYLCENIYCTSYIDATYTILSNGEQFLGGYCDNCMQYIRNRFDEHGRRYFNELVDEHWKVLAAYTGKKDGGRSAYERYFEGGLEEPTIRDGSSINDQMNRMREQIRDAQNGQTFYTTTTSEDIDRTYAIPTEDIDSDSVIREPRNPEVVEVSGQSSTSGTINWRNYGEQDNRSNTIITSPSMTESFNRLMNDTND